MSVPFGPGREECAPADRYDFIELFAGIGCAATGLGVGPGGAWKVAFANDHSEQKARLYRLHHPGVPLRVCDISELTASDLPYASLWWGSGPCKDVSLAGNQRGVTGPESGKVFAIGELLRQMEHGRRPAVLVFENVPNLLTKRMGFEAFAKDVQDCGYRLGALVVDAVHWVPCSRERVFVIAYREGLPLPEGCVKDRPGPHWHPPSLLRAYARLDAETKAKWVWWHLPPPPSTAPMLAQILEQDGVRAEDWFGPDLLNRFGDLVGLAPTYLAKLEAAMAADGVVWGVTVEKTDTKQPEGQYYYRGRPCKRRIAEFRAGVVFTLCATVTGTSRQKLVKVHGRKVAIREFRPREVARSIGVPDELAVPDTVGGAFRAFGDAVAPPVVRHLSANILEALVAAAREFEAARATGTLPPRVEATRARKGAVRTAADRPAVSKDGCRKESRPAAGRCGRSGQKSGGRVSDGG